MKQKLPSSQLEAAPGVNRRASQISGVTTERGDERSRLDRSQAALWLAWSAGELTFPANGCLLSCIVWHASWASLSPKPFRADVCFRARHRLCGSGNATLRAPQALFTGDMILGCGSAIFDDFESYMASLRRVLAISSARDGGFTR